MIGYIYTSRALNVGQTYSAKRSYGNYNFTVYDNPLAICRYQIIDGMHRYEVSTNGMGATTVVREVSKDEYIHMCTGQYVDREGNQLWYVSGKLHRTDGPAVICADGSKGWRIDGQHHREDGPAVIFADGTKKWYHNGVNHREDGPADIRLDGTKIWWNYGNPIDPPSV